MLRMLLAVFATYRVSRLISEEDGPLGVFQGLRDHFGASFTAEWDDMGEVAKLLRCKYCNSMWFAALMLLAPASVLKWLAVAGASYLLLELTD